MAASDGKRWAGRHHAGADGMRMLDLFCGRFGWGRAFAERGWEVIGVDLIEPPDIPAGAKFVRADILTTSIGPICGQFYYADSEGSVNSLGNFDFICSSSPCEEFSIHGMKHFHKNPKYPDMGIKLFNHTRFLCEASGAPYVMENVRSAQQFVGAAVHHCGPFYLWGNCVPPIVPQGIKKGFQTGGAIIQKLKKIDRHALTNYRRQNNLAWSSSGSKKRKEFTAQVAMIPPELSNCVADYATRVIEQRECA
jgi:hypothetical protein